VGPFQSISPFFHEALKLFDAGANIICVRLEVKLREELARLISLQTLDRETQELSESLAQITQRVNELRQALDANQAELDRLLGEEKEAEAARRRLEKELAEGEARIRNKRMRQSLVRNEKELQAIGHEVESLKENNQRIEADLLVQMESADPRAARIKELTELIDADRKALREAELEIAAQAEDLKSAIGRKRAERERLSAAIEPNLLQRYEIIFSRRGGTAVVEAKMGACHGCRMRLPPQLYNEIQKFQKIHFCPNCQRILFYPEL
jgi:predicted  nucleic acid-binding Zn-ribbon protein